MEWVSVSHDQELIFDVLAASPSTEGFIAGVADGAVWYSRDAGRTWDSFDWPGECTGIVVVNSDVPTFLLSGAWGIIEASAADDERVTRFSGPVTDVEQWSGGTLYATAGSVVACGDDIQEMSECIALVPPSTHPVRRVIHDPDRDRWYILTSGPELYLKDGDTPWQLLATGL
jgi:hypothetical protein